MARPQEERQQMRFFGYTLADENTPQPEPTAAMIE
jgi:hypothetical protein